MTTLTWLIPHLTEFLSTFQKKKKIKAQRGIMWTHTWLIRASLTYKHINLICLHNISPLGAFLTSLLGKLLFFHFCITVYVQSSCIGDTHAMGNETFPAGNNWAELGSSSLVDTHWQPFLSGSVLARLFREAASETTSFH